MKLLLRLIGWSNSLNHFLSIYCLCFDRLNFISTTAIVATNNIFSKLTLVGIVYSQTFASTTLVFIHTWIHKSLLSASAYIQQFRRFSFFWDTHLNLFNEIKEQPFQSEFPIITLFIITKYMIKCIKEFRFLHIIGIVLFNVFNIRFKLS